jgi:hypothetical protein
MLGYPDEQVVTLAVLVGVSYPDEQVVTLAVLVGVSYVVALVMVLVALLQPMFTRRTPPEET